MPGNEVLFVLFPFDFITRPDFAPLPVGTQLDVSAITICGISGGKLRSQKQVRLVIASPK